MAKGQLPTPAELCNLLNYDPQTGKMFWRERTPSAFKDGNRSANHKAANWNSKYAGKEAFTAKNADGYFTGSVNDRMYRAHRVAWAIYYGAWPTGQIDHVNHDRADNRIENLRDIPQAENKRNQKRRVDNTSGVTGVTWMKRRRKWHARIVAQGKVVCIGNFETIEQAIAARRQAQDKYGFHENHGSANGGTVAFECSDRLRKTVSGQ